MANKENLKEQLAGLRAFMSSSAYGSYLNTLDLDIRDAETSILATPPVSVADIALLNQIHGQRQQMLEAKELFVSSCSAIEAKLVEIDQQETNMGTKI